MDIVNIPIFHITQISNLERIIARGELLSDARMIEENLPTHAIGDADIKHRRLNEITTDCPPCRKVGEFVPFYYCPRSPMLYRINKGGTGLAEGCQSEIVHLVSKIGLVVQSGQTWVIADGNAGAFHTSFSNTLDDIRELNWPAIKADYWSDVVHHKQAEFLVADTFSWGLVTHIGCYDMAAKQRVDEILRQTGHIPRAIVKREWYY